MAVLFFFILSGTCFAGIAVSPLQQRVVVKPGRKTTFNVSLSYNIRGDHAQNCPVSAKVVDFVVSDTGQLSFGPEHRHVRSAVDWIKFEEEDFVLEPGESRRLKATVTAPINADGDYWAAVMIGTGNSKESQKGVQVNLRTASGVFIHVARRNYVERGDVTDANVILPEFEISDFSEENTAEPGLNGIKKNQALKINAKLENDGLIAFLARGKTYIYSENWRRIAVVPLYANRRRVLPGDSRWFTGVMTNPMPAGQYKLRTFFASESEYKRKITKDIELTISEELAQIWAENFVSDKDTQMLEIKPQQIELKLTPGRLTATRFQITNQSSGTVVANCRVEGKELCKDWLEIKTADFALAPNARRSTTCLVKVPADAQPGEYNWTIYVETERSGLTSQKQGNVKEYEIPIRVLVNEIVHIAASKQD